MALNYPGYQIRPSKPISVEPVLVDSCWWREREQGVLKCQEGVVVVNVYILMLASIFSVLKLRVNVIWSRNQDLLYPSLLLKSLDKKAVQLNESGPDS